MVFYAVSIYPTTARYSDTYTFTDQQTVWWLSVELSVIHGSSRLALPVLLVELYRSCQKRAESRLHCFYVKSSTLPTSVLLCITNEIACLTSNTIWGKYDDTYLRMLVREGIMHGYHAENYVLPAAWDVYACRWKCNGVSGRYSRGLCY